MPFPDLTLQIAPGVSWQTFPAEVDWQEITADLESATIKDGKQSDLGGFETATLDVSLHNANRQYEPDYSGSPYYPYLRPDTWIRLLAAPGGDNAKLGTNALNFDGVDDYVSIPAAVSTAIGAAAVTVEAWIKADALPGAGVVWGIVTDYYTGDNNVHFSLHVDGTTGLLKAGFYNGAWREAVDTVVLATGVWTHVAGTYDGLNVRLYKNGILAATTLYVGVMPIGTTGWRIGRRWDAAEFFDGVIDDVRFWSVARTQAEISLTMNLELTGAEVGLVAYYKFNEGIGTQAIDSKLLGVNHGTIFGANYVNAVYAKFTGLIEDPDPAWVLPSKIRIKAADAMKLLSTKSVENPYVAEVLKDTPKMYWRLGEANINDPATDASGNGLNGQYIGGVAFNQIDPITDDNNGAIKMFSSVDYVRGPALFSGTGAFAMEMWFRTSGGTRLYAFTQTHDPFFGSAGPWIALGMDGQQAVFETSQNSPSGSVHQVFGTTNINDDQFHHLVGVREVDGTIRIYVDGVLQTSLAGAADIVVAATVWVGKANGGIWYADEVAFYDHALTAARVAAHYAARNGWAGDSSGQRITKLADAVGWPTSKRQIDTGDSILQGSASIGNLLEHARLVEATESGGLYCLGDGTLRFRARSTIMRVPYTTSQATIGRAAGELPYSKITPSSPASSIKNDVTIQRSGGLAQRAVDAVTPFIIRAYAKTGLLHANDSDARDQAFFILDRYKDFKLRFSHVGLQPDPVGDDALWTAILTLGLEQLITATRIPPDGTATVQRQGHIIGSETVISKRRGWKTVWRLGDADTRQFWLVGVAGRSEVGQTTRVGY